MFQIREQIREESLAFIESLFQSVEDNKNEIYNNYSNRLNTLHKAIFPIYILNHYKDYSFISDYYQILMSNIIESQSLMGLGFYNSGMNILRSAIESSFKLLYYETHPVENILHNEGQHSLTITEYREFMYNHPLVRQLRTIERDKVEAIWKDLCSYVHNDIKAIKTISVLTDIKSVYTFSEREFQTVIEKYKNSVKIIVTIFLVLNNEWTKNIEKTYYDFIIDIYSPEEIRSIKEVLKIY
ncbi:MULTISPECIES: hypothetical protein [unclassified Paenibacillus]|uniref:hypothetical protein n=1 Tax=unclassified Paenibacillus TaxID=185978 RepID=UPI000AAA415F|nr:MULTISPECIES: hypothetical protein [unclassified Paenibacillus]